MRTDSVWLSDLPRDGSNVVTNIDFDRHEPARRAILTGGEPNPDDMRVSAFERYADSPIKELPPLFDGAGALTITGELAEPFFKFDLGRSLILPLRVFKHDRETEIFADRKYHIILRIDVFQALAPHASKVLSADSFDDPPKRWEFSFGEAVKDGDVAVNREALDSPLQWTDPALINSHFFNGELVAEMRKNDTAEYWNLKRCRIVD